MHTAKTTRRINLLGTSAFLAEGEDVRIMLATNIPKGDTPMWWAIPCGRAQDAILVTWDDLKDIRPSDSIAQLRNVLTTCRTLIEAPHWDTSRRWSVYDQLGRALRYADTVTWADTDIEETR